MQENEVKNVVNNYTIIQNEEAKNKPFWGRITYLIVGGVCGVLSACFRGFGMYKFNTHRSANFGYLDNSVLKVRESYLKAKGYDVKKFLKFVDVGLDKLVGVGVNSAGASVGVVAGAKAGTTALAFNPYVFVGMLMVNMVFTILATEEQNKATAQMRIMLESMRQVEGNIFDKTFFNQYMNLIIKSRFFYSWFIWFMEKMFLFLGIYAFVCAVIDSDRD